MKNLNFTLLLALAGMFAFVSCEDDSNDTESGSDTETNYVVCLRNNASTSENSDYMIAVDDLMSDEISAEGQGVELLGWDYLEYFEGNYFAIDHTNSLTTAYQVNNGAFTEAGSFTFDAMSSFSALDDDYFLSMGAPWGGGNYNIDFQLINTDGSGKKTVLSHPLYTSFYSDEDTTLQLNAWPTYCYKEDNKLFVFFYTMDGISWETLHTDTAYCSVFTYEDETITYKTTFKDSRTSPIGYYCEQPCVVEDEDGNHYAFSNCSFVAGNTQVTKQSGILKINAGEEAFDDDYFYNVEEASGYKILSGAYAGDGNVVANVISTENDTEDASWAAFSIDVAILETAIINVENQTFTLVDDVPLHGGQYHTPMLVEDGMVYISVNDGEEAYIYEVDASTATATRGAKIEGDELQAIIKNN